MNWVTIKKFAELSGYSEEAIRNKTKKGVWQYTIHFTKAPDGRILINISEVEKWLTNTPV